MRSLLSPGLWGTARIEPAARAVPVSPGGTGRGTKSGTGTPKTLKWPIALRRTSRNVDERTNSFGYWLRRRRKALDLTQETARPERRLLALRDPEDRGGRASPVAAAGRAPRRQARHSAAGAAMRSSRRRAPCARSIGWSVRHAQPFEAVQPAVDAARASSPVRRAEQRVRAAHRPARPPHAPAPVTSC